MTQQSFRRHSGYAPERHGNSGWNRRWSVRLLDGTRVIRHSLTELYDYLTHNRLRLGDIQNAAPVSSVTVNVRGVRL